MRVAVTGTPGTGKTTATDLVNTELSVIHLNDVIRDEALVHGRDPERETLVADLEGLQSWLGERDDLLIESHLAHQLPADRIIVLRCHPAELEGRLQEREEPPATIEENVESEILDIILAEAVEEHGRAAVYEIDTSEQAPNAVAAEIEAVIEGRREPAVGIVDFTEAL